MLETETILNFIGRIIISWILQCACEVKTVSSVLFNSPHTTHISYLTLSQNMVFHIMTFQVTITYLLEPVNSFIWTILFEDISKIHWMFLCLLNRVLPVMILSLYFAWQFRVSAMNIRLPCRVVIQKHFPIRLKRAIRNGLRLLKCLFICSSWICLFSFFCLPRLDMIIFMTLAHSNRFALSDILFLIYYELINHIPRLVKVVYTERIY